MTVESGSSRAQYSTNGTSGPWTVPFYFLESSHLKVYHTDVAGEETLLTLNVDYNVLGAGNPNGGTVTTTEAYVSGGSITLLRDVPATQGTDYRTADSFPAESHEIALDKLTMLAQQLIEIVSRALVFGVAEGVSPVLPAASDRANKLLGFDSLGRPTALIPAAGSASALALDLLSATQASKGAALVGLGGTQAYSTGSVGRRLVERVSPHDYPWLAPVNGTTDATVAVQDCLTWAATNGRGVDFTPGRTYKISQIVFPDYSNISADGAEFRSDGSLSGGSDITVDIGDHCVFDSLKITTPGTETNTDILRIGEDFWASKVEILSDAQRAGGGVITTGQDVQIGILKTRKIDRPLHLYNQSTSAQTTGSFIGHLDIEDYVRGFRADYCSFTTGTMHMRGRSVNASMTAGHNSVLIVGCDGWQMGNLYLADAGEHAFRIGGSPGTYARTRNFQVGNVVAERCGGCALKINPTLLASVGVTETCDRFSFGNIVGIDVGDGTVTGNEELLRLTHVRRWRIASAIAYTKNETRSAQYALQINDSDDGEIGVLGGEALNGGFINILGTSDVDGVNYFGSHVTDLRIGRLLGSTVGNNAIGVNTTFNVGRIFIGDMDITGFANYLLLWSSGTASDVIDITGWVTGAVAPVVSGLPTSAHLVGDVRHGNLRSAGRWNYLRSLAGAFQITQAAFSPTDVLPAGFFANAGQATAGSGNYGGSFEMGRPGTGRRGAAIAAKQTGASAQNMGLALLAGASSEASDLLFELAVLKHNGSLHFLNLPVFADNAAALSGGLVAGDTYSTSAGAVRIVV